MGLLTLQDTIERLNIKGVEELSLAITTAQKNNPDKVIISARYSDDDWKKAIRAKDWKAITKMYHSTRFGTITKVCETIMKSSGLMEVKNGLSK